MTSSLRASADDRAARRREVREVIEYLRSDLFERDRDYSGSRFDITPLEVEDPDTETVWGSPLGWRVTIKVFDDQSLILAVHGPTAFLHASSPPFRVADFNRGVCVGWLEGWLP